MIESTGWFAYFAKTEFSCSSCIETIVSFVMNYVLFFERIFAILTISPRTDILTGYLGGPLKEANTTISGCSGSGCSSCIMLRSSTIKINRCANTQEKKHFGCPNSKTNFIHCLGLRNDINEMEMQLYHNSTM